jgi:hypothetical protein
MLSPQPAPPPGAARITKVEKAKKIAAINPPSSGANNVRTKSR